MAHGGPLIGESQPSTGARLRWTRLFAHGKAIHAGPETVKRVLADFPELGHELTTGGARPVHIMSTGQLSTKLLTDAGADIYAVATNGYTAWHRMASNNLAEGGRVLVGMDPNERQPSADSTPNEIARRSNAIQFLMEMQKLGKYN